MSVYLPKWPALLVSGESVSPEQAEQIIIRTSDLYFSSNDYDFTRRLYASLGIEADPSMSSSHYFSPNWEDLSEVSRELGVLDLEYLGNRQIVSSYIGGPHGWCDWNGTIGCNSYNIGKYPSEETVTEEWERIAQAFPFLNLKSQLFSGESSEDDSHPVIQFNVSDGRVEVVSPEPGLTYEKTSSVDKFITQYGCNTRERGCTIEQFVKAVDTVRKVQDKDICLA